MIFRNKFNHTSLKPLFIVTSDSTHWIEDNFSGISDVIILKGGSAELDFATLASCQHFIMSTGTFSWWAAYLTQGEVVYYDRWPHPGSRVESETNLADVFPSDWIPMH